MKKLLLSLIGGCLAVGSLSAATDGQTYETVNGLTCTSLWNVEPRHDKAAYESLGISNWGDARQCTLLDGVVYLADPGANDPTVTDADGGVLYSAKFRKFDAETGEYLGELKVMNEDGTRLTGQLCLYSVGVDDFGHLWALSFSASNATPIRVRVIDPVTGIAKVTGELTKEDVEGRSDMGDLLGDATHTQARCVVVVPVSSGAGIWMWACEAGEEEWIGGFEGDVVGVPIDAFVPESAAAFGISPLARFVPGEGEEKYNGRLFYIDGHGTSPAMYDNTGALVEGSNFIGQDENAPASGANGIIEFSLAGKNFIGYAYQIWASDPTYSVRICQVADDYTFTELTHYWTLPADGMAPETGDAYKSSVFAQGIDRRYLTDANGKEAIQIVTSQCKVGICSYLIAEEGFQSTFGGVESAVVNNAANINVKGGVVTVSAEASEIAVYAVNGQLVAKANNATQVAVDAKGAYIVKATVNGQPVVKKVVL